MIAPAFHVRVTWFGAKPGLSRVRPRDLSGAARQLGDEVTWRERMKPRGMESWLGDVSAAFVATWDFKGRGSRWRVLDTWNCRLAGVPVGPAKSLVH